MWSGDEAFLESGQKAAGLGVIERVWDEVAVTWKYSVVRDSLFWLAGASTPGSWNKQRVSVGGKRSVAKYSVVLGVSRPGPETDM